MPQENPAWYEAQTVKDMMALMGGKALRGLMSNVFSSGRIYKGKVAFLQVANYLKAMFDKEERRALIITDSFTQKYAKKLIPFLDMIEMDYKIWSGAEPEVPTPSIDIGAQICEEFKPQVIFAIGGGSVMDTAKMVMLKYEYPEKNILMILPYFGSVGLRRKFRFFIAIPTTSGTGAEVTPVAVLTDTDRNPPKKLEVLVDEFPADITILDTEFVKDMPPLLTAGTGMDAFSHAVGSYVSNWGSPYIDAMNFTAIKEIVKYLPRAYKYGAKDIEARDHMHLASMMAGIGFGNTVPGIDHALGHSVGKIFGIHHGLAVGLYLPYCIEFQAKVTDRWLDLCPVFNISIDNKPRDVLLKEFIAKVKVFIQSIDVPSRIADFKNPVISKEEYMEKIDLLVSYAEDDAVSLTSYRALNSEVYKKLLIYAYEGKEIDF